MLVLLLFLLFFIKTFIIKIMRMINCKVKYFFIRFVMLISDVDDDNDDDDNLLCSRCASELRVS